MVALVLATPVLVGQQCADLAREVELDVIDVVAAVEAEDLATQEVDAQEVVALEEMALQVPSPNPYTGIQEV
jgi:hypothetical protein